jgi:hypothetical protein
MISSPIKFKYPLIPMALTQAKTLMYPEFVYGRMIGGSFHECLGGFAACGLLRENFPQSSDLSRHKRISEAP